MKRSRLAQFAFIHILSHAEPSVEALRLLVDHAPNSTGPFLVQRGTCYQDAGFAEQRNDLSREFGQRTMINLTKEEASLWLERYGAAWRAGDADSVITLFTEDAIYHDLPFEQPMNGRNAIKQYWIDGAVTAQDDIEFGYEIWATTDDQCLSHWFAKFRRIKTDEKVEVDGVFRLLFVRHTSGEIECRSLQEWWHRK